VDGPASAGDVALDDEQASLLVRHGKGGRARRQAVPPQLAAELRAVRDRREAGPEDPVFCGLAGGRLQPKILAEIVHRCAKRTRLHKRVTVHTLRHTAATWLRQGAADTRLVAEYLGHADLSTVGRYAHVGDDELHAAVTTLARRAGLQALGSQPKRAGPRKLFRGPAEVRDIWRAR
jgi:integrase/recombinase XerC